MNALRQLRIIAFLEGLSFVILLFIGLPMKYLAGIPVIVRIVGSVHGVVFLVFVFALLRVAIGRRWSWGRAALGFVASLVPFGTFAFDFLLRRELADAEGGAVRAA